MGEGQWWMGIFLGKTRGRAILFVFDLLHVCLFVAALSLFGYCQAPFAPSKIQRPISGTQTGLTGDCVLFNVLQTASHIDSLNFSYIQPKAH